MAKDATYFLRWSQDDQHEYTPAGQEDLARWTDMLTINYHRDLNDPAGLELLANHVLGSYRANNATIIRTASLPATDTTPAEYLAVAAFRTAELVEVAMTRFKLLDDMAAAVTYSRRAYGDGAVDQAMTWLQDHGAPMEAALMRLDAPTEPVETVSLT
jgi:hypothetical protein